jgi:hypothetical protein
MPSPIIFRHISQRGVDSALSGDCVGAGGEEFGYAGGFETGFCEADGCAEAGAAGSYYYCVVVVVDYGVVEV